MTRGEIARKAVHIGIGFGALLLPWLTRWQTVGICLFACLMNGLVLPRHTHHLLEREEERKRGFAQGIIEYPLVVGLVAALFGSRMEIVAAAWAILAFGDGFATVAGRLLGGPRLPWNQAKSVTGLMAFIGVGGLASTLMALWVITDARSEEHTSELQSLR